LLAHVIDTKFTSIYGVALRVIIAFRDGIALAGRLVAMVMLVGATGIHAMHRIGDALALLACFAGSAIRIIDAKAVYRGGQRVAPE
jgi:hypothetical protein